ncbi:hypothetical protein BXZ70DRAFT_693662 [Cristinia sonorae]|uniref:DUF6534 domain-containing protein n=1 Tax=Cristinia sonorae TaxID=1940300 RepID=A0A8K0XJX5_9AGAR|nr:hypothetical protein BXZ70DRAFT_693662 [Cristinia sonorae]
MLYAGRSRGLKMPYLTRDLPQDNLDLKVITGPILFEAFINFWLFGILTVQVYVYYLAFPKDNWHSKVVVYLAYAIELGQVVLIMLDAFRVFVRAWSNPLLLDAVGYSNIDVSIMAGMTGTLSQLFYAWRIYVVSQTYTIPIIVSLLSISQLCFSVWDAIMMNFVGHVSLFQHSKVFVTTLCWNIATSLCDLLITCSMLYYLWKARKTTLARRNSNILTRLIRITVETGFISSAVTVIGLIIFVAKPDTDLFVVATSTISKMYSNTLLAVLNSRIRIVGSRIKDLDISTPSVSLPTFHLENSLVTEQEVARNEDE